MTDVVGTDYDNYGLPPRTQNSAATTSAAKSFTTAPKFHDIRPEIGTSRPAEG